MLEQASFMNAKGSSCTNLYIVGPFFTSLCANVGMVVKISSTCKIAIWNAHPANAVLQDWTLTKNKPLRKREDDGRVSCLLQTVHLQLKGGKFRSLRCLNKGEGPDGASLASAMISMVDDLSACSAATDPGSHSYSGLCFEGIRSFAPAVAMKNSISLLH